MEEIMGQNTFNSLVGVFDVAKNEYKTFEQDYISNPPSTVSQMEERLNGLIGFLSRFTDLEYQVTKEALAQDPMGRRAKLLSILAIMINKIQFVHLTPLSQKLNYRYNRNNVRLAYFSIVFGLLCTVFSLLYPAYVPDPNTTLLKQMAKKLEIIEKQTKIALPSKNLSKKINDSNLKMKASIQKK